MKLKPAILSALVMSIINLLVPLDTMFPKGVEIAILAVCSIGSLIMLYLILDSFFDG